MARAGRLATSAGSETPDPSHSCTRLRESVDIRILSSLKSVDPRAWNDLAGEDDPFIEHAFLSLLEESGSVGHGSGWEPSHVTAWRGKKLVGAFPLYLKTHSYGEYIFDWGWADAASRIGIGYYPKLVAMVPVTLLAVICGVVFDGWQAFLYVLAGAMGASAIGFMGGRLLGRSAIERVSGSRIAHLSRRLAKRGTVAVAILRLIS